MFDSRSSLEKCFGGGPFCWNQKPEELYCFIVQPKAGFPKGDSLYKYNNLLKKWNIECAGDSTCTKGCLVHAMQHRDPEYMNRVYYNVGDVDSHLKHAIEMNKLRSIKKKEK